MEIKAENNKVTGKVDYNGKGSYEVILLYVEDGEIKIGSSMVLPIHGHEAKLVLACYNAAFSAAEIIANSQKVSPK